jgi:hypothetical protein
MPLDYTPAGNQAFINVAHRSEYSLLVQSKNWADLGSLFTDPAGWFREIASKWHQTPFEVRRPATLVVQHLSRTYGGVFRAAQLANLLKPGSVDLEFAPGNFRDRPIEVTVAWYAKFVENISKEYPCGYFQAELAIETNTVTVSYIQPDICPEATVFPNVEITKATVATAPLPGSSAVYNPQEGYIVGRAHFDLSVPKEDLARTRGYMIKEYIESCDCMCCRMNALNPGDLLYTSAATIPEGDQLGVGASPTPALKKFASTPIETTAEAAYAAVAMTTPTVIAQGMSSTSDTYICIDTSILEGEAYYPTDVLYKLYYQ